MLKNLCSCHISKCLKNVGELSSSAKMHTCKTTMLGQCLRLSGTMVPMTRYALLSNSANMRMITHVPVCHRICTKSVGVDDVAQPQWGRTVNLGHNSSSILRGVEQCGFSNTTENLCKSSSVHTGIMKSPALPSSTPFPPLPPHLDPGHPARRGSTSGMSGPKTLTLANVVSNQNKERIVTNLSSKRKLHRFYTKDIKKRGAVVVPLCSVDGEPCILFTLRTRTLKDHSGEVSFPGGKMDPTDDDVCYTALRELQEELGIDPSSVDVWGNLSPVGRESLTVVPVIGYLGEVDIKSMAYNPDEVASVFVMSLSHLCSGASQAYTVFEPHESSGQATATLPVFVGGEHRVWGLTAFILDEALLAIVPDHYRSLVAQVKKEQMKIKGL